MNEVLAIIFAVISLGCLRLRASRGREMDLEQWRWAVAVSARSSSSCCWPARSTRPSPSSALAVSPTPRRTRLLHPVLRSARVCAVVLAGAGDLALRQVKRLMSQPDCFVHKYGSPNLGVVVALIGIVAMIPYLVLQLTGLGIIVAEACYGSISHGAAIWIRHDRADRLRHDLRVSARSAWNAGGQGHPRSCVVVFARHLPAAASLRRHRPDVPADRRRQAGVPRLPGTPRASPGSSAPSCS